MSPARDIDAHFVMVYIIVARRAYGDIYRQIKRLFAATPCRRKDTLLRH